MLRKLLILALTLLRTERPFAPAPRPAHDGGALGPPAPPPATTRPAGTRHARRRLLQAQDLAQRETRLRILDDAIQAVLARLPEAALLRTIEDGGPAVAAAVLAYLSLAVWGRPKAAAGRAGAHPPYRPRANRAPSDEQDGLQPPAPRPVLWRPIVPAMEAGAARLLRAPARPWPDQPGRPGGGPAHVPAAPHGPPPRAPERAAAGLAPRRASPAPPAPRPHVGARLTDLDAPNRKGRTARSTSPRTSRIAGCSAPRRRSSTCTSGRTRGTQCLRTSSRGPEGAAPPAPSAGERPPGGPSACGRPRSPRRTCSSGTASPRP